MSKSAKTVLIIVGVILVAVVIFALFLGGENWEEDLKIEYLGEEREDLLDHNPLYKYRLTNNTNRRLANMVIVFKCENGEGSSWKFRHEAGNLMPGEQKIVEIYMRDMVEPFPLYVSMYSFGHTIADVKYKK